MTFIPWRSLSISLHKAPPTAPMPPKATTFASCRVPTSGLGGGGGAYFTSRHFFQVFEVSVAHTPGKNCAAPSPLSLRWLNPSLVEKSSKQMSVNFF